MEGRSSPLRMTPRPAPGPVDEPSTPSCGTPASSSWRGRVRRIGASPTRAPGQSRRSSEQTLTDLFNLTQLYQRMGRLAGGNPLPFVGSFAYFAGRGDSTIALLSVSLDNRALSFQRAGRDFTARYRVEVGFQKAGALPLRYAREEAVTVTTFNETQRADETVLFQQAFLLPPGSVHGVDRRARPGRRHLQPRRRRPW